MPEDKDKSKKETKALDLLGDSKKKPSRRERQRDQATVEKTLDDKKKEALDMFSDEGKKKHSGIKKKSVKEAEEEEKARQAKEADATPASTTTPVIASKESNVTASDSDSKIISIKPPIVVSALADDMGLKPFQLMADLIKLQIFVAPHQAIEPEIAAKLCEQHGFIFEREKREKGGGVHKTAEVIEEPKEVETEPEEELQLRAPIITLMGHVDHGKTSLMDRIRESRVAAGEAGGITQHIGAYSVKDPSGRPVTFLDTPGHAIFSKMRARGADITDIIVVVIAANDGIMPQTLEAINHAKSAKKEMIIAINKCDLPAADPMRVKTQLMEHELTPVDFGGTTECIEISAATGDGVDDLMELLALQAEVLELQANPKAIPRASIIEARIQPGKGPTASVIVENGTLKVGQAFICGPFAGKVKSMIDDKGNVVKTAGPSTPVEILGFAELPNVGDTLVGMTNERKAKKLAEERQTDQRQERLKGGGARITDIMTLVKGGSKAQLNIILKADAQGSVGAIIGAIEDIESSKVDVRFIHSAAGSITESDILLASSSGGIVFGFNTKVESKAVTAAKKEGVEIKLYSIVYELIDTVELAMLGLLEPETRETIIGHADVKQVFKVNKGLAAGCYVSDGKASRKSNARVIRGKVPVYDGKMTTLRRFKDEVDEVKVGLECGIKLGDFNGYEEGDIIECYTLDKVAQKLN